MAEIETTVIYEYLHDRYVAAKGKVLFSLEGSSGSAKSWSIIDFVIDYCRIHAFENKLLTIGRESYKDCYDTVIHDFIKRLKMIGGYEEDKHFQSHPQKYFLLGNEINFTGWSTNGQPSKRQDFLWFNEVFESKEEIFKQYNQRTNDVVIVDYNPKVTEHWVYDKINNRPDCFWRHCKMIDNPFLPLGQKNELLAYEPWLPGSYEVDIDSQLIKYNGNPIGQGNFPPPHPINVAAGTADMYMWMVYGLGLRMAQTGLIFPMVEYIDEWPEGLDYHWGLDLGFSSDPCVLTRYAEEGRNIYLAVESYAPMETPELVHEYALSRGIDITKNVTADSSDKYVSETKGVIEMVRGLRKLGWNVHKVSKTKSVMYWLTSMKKYKIHIVKNDLYDNAKREQQNYKMKEINGVPINAPVDKHNHFWDSCFPSGTKIYTSKGLIDIELICNSDLVLTSCGYKKIEKIHNNGIKEIYDYCLLFDTFSLTLRSTEDHLIKTENEWKQISKLNQGDVIILNKNLMVKYLNYIPENDIIQEDVSDYIERYGSFIMAKYLKGLMFIIKMKILSIIESKISKLSNKESTPQCTLKNDLKQIRNGQRNLWIKVLKLLKNGTNLKKGENGTNNTQQISISDLKLMAYTNAFSVMKNLRRNQKIRNFVPINVNQNIEEIINSMTLKEPVLFVDKNSNQINTVKAKLVRKYVGGKKEEVAYDLSIEDQHEYFANGILVHNCRYAHMAEHSNAANFYIEES